MKVSKRGAIKTVGLAILLSTLPTYADGQQDFGLRTVYDQYSAISFDQSVALKALKLAQYVVSRHEHPKSYEDYMSTIIQKIVSVKIEFNDMSYEVMVIAQNKKRQLKASDSLSIKFGSKGTQEFEKTIVQDRGLDGRCDYGAWPRSRQSGSGLNADLDLFWSRRRDGHKQPEFQKAYVKVLDDLIRFYETPKKG